MFLMLDKSDMYLEEGLGVTHFLKEKNIPVIAANGITFMVAVFLVLKATFNFSSTDDI